MFLGTIPNTVSHSYESQIPLHEMMVQLALWITGFP